MSSELSRFLLTVNTPSLLCLTDDQGSYGEDLTGGWYDAGDNVKFNFPMSFSVTTLAWGVLEYWDAYVTAGELDNVVDSIKWPLDYLIKCHIQSNGQTTRLYAQVPFLLSFSFYVH